MDCCFLWVDRDFVPVDRPVDRCFFTRGPWWTVNFKKEIFLENSFFENYSPPRSTCEKQRSTGRSTGTKSRSTHKKQRSTGFGSPDMVSIRVYVRAVPLPRVHVRVVARTRAHAHRRCSICARAQNPLNNIAHGHGVTHAIFCARTDDSRKSIVRPGERCLGKEILGGACHAELGNHVGVVAQEPSSKCWPPT